MDNLDNGQSQIFRWAIDNRQSEMIGNGQAAMGDRNRQSAMSDRQWAMGNGM